MIYMIDPLDAKLEDDRALECVNTDDRLIVNQLADEPAASNWKPLPIRWVHGLSGRAISDYPRFSISAFSHRAKEVLDPILRMHGEYLPLTGVENRYVGYHVLSISRALDVEQSELSYNEVAQMITTIWKAAFKKERLEAFKIFHVAGNRSRVFVQQEFVDLVVEHSLTGFTFKKCDLT